MRSAPLPDRPFRVLFVCLGNICRSPLAEGLFRRHVEEAGLAGRIEIASAGTGAWHVGKPPDKRMCATASKRGVDISHQRARHLCAEDLRRSDLVLAMDRENLANIRALGSADLSSNVVLFRHFDPEPGTGEVPDPYYGGDEGFAEVFDIVDRTSRALLGELRREHGF
ncbi:low molecular weight protein-tyrosine-phosphatase [Vulgatibacter incomptus]|uniref:protein-tyrosine-phosphatase n=1 Tax=Vulgatibacter incomptus TaxID=1391653 RepID=A0A0K1PES9_9BACT|nr:low molecular weight protein-tyrosine-phosphatase [Vulgatibacter incomptus]AKU92007.1 Low molecular weight protein tyrosine phosphatase [Vulgatibacter incomptus]